MKMSNHHAKVNEPADHLAVVDALYRFGAGQDPHDSVLLTSAFVEDAHLDFTQPAKRLGVDMAVLRGRQQIVDSITSTVSRLDTTHTVTNPRTALNGNEAELFALVDAYHVPHDDPGRHLQLKNIYRVSLVRGDGDWRISRMHIHNVWMTGEPAVLFG
jgi:SnoaL-like domain